MRCFYISFLWLCCASQLRTAHRCAAVYQDDFSYQDDGIDDEDSMSEFKGGASDDDIESDSDEEEIVSVKKGGSKKSRKSH